MFGSKLTVRLGFKVALVAMVVCSCAQGPTTPRTHQQSELNARAQTSGALYGAWQSLADLPRGYSFYMQLLPDGTFSTIWHYLKDGKAYYHPAKGKFTVTELKGNISFVYDDSNACGPEHYSLDDGKTISYRLTANWLSIIYAEDPDRTRLPGERKDGKVDYKRLIVVPAQPADATLRCHEGVSSF